MAMLRIGKILENLQFERHLSREKLATAINDRNKGTGLENVTAPKLIPFLNGKMDSLSIGVYKAIFNFLREEGLQGVDHLFENERLLADLVAQKSVRLFIPFKAVGDRNYVSSWDEKAHIEILGRINADFRETALRTIELPERDLASIPTAAAQKQTRDLVELDNSRSYCVISSPTVSDLGEIVFSMFFAATPYRRPSSSTQLPFFFIWHPKNGAVIDSCVALAPNDLLTRPDITNASESFVKLIEKSDGQAFLTLEDQRYTVHEVDLTKNERDDYGVIVARRTQHGNVIVVIAGLSGIGTWGAASKLADFNRSIPDAQPNAPSSIVYAVVKVGVTRNPTWQRQGDPRTSKNDARFIVGPKIWS